MVCDLLDKEEALIAALTYSNKFRVLKPNEPYYQDYDSKKSYISERYEDDDE